MKNIKKCICKCTGDLSDILEKDNEYDFHIDDEGMYNLKIKAYYVALPKEIWDVYFEERIL